MEALYPVKVDLAHVDGNAFSVMGAVTTAMRRYGCSTKEVDAFRTEAMSGDYDNLLRTCMKYVNVVFDEDDDDLLSDDDEDW